jgi:serine/threonine protein kinase
VIAVFKAKWSATEDVVCVKKLKNVRAGELHNFWAEVNLCARLRCPYLVQFLGGVTQHQHLAIVTEYMKNGTLFDYLHRRKRTKPAAAASAPSASTFSHPLGEWFVVRAARQIAMGMNYLANHGIVHRYPRPICFHHLFVCMLMVGFA